MKYKINADYEDSRLDKFIRKKYKNEKLSNIFRSIRKGKIKVNGKKVKENYRLKINDEIEVFLIGETTTDFIVLTNDNINDLKKWIIYEDNDLLICNKPSGISMHKGTKNLYGISEMYKAYLNSDEFNFANRIDKETQGIVIGCKNQQSLKQITKLIRDREIKKKYYAIVSGIINEDIFEIENYLEETPEKVVISDETNGKLSKTNFKVLNRNVEKNETLLDVELLTGRKHQIRVHLQSYGYPIKGDKKYGVSDEENVMQLYCYEISFLDKTFQIEIDNILS